MLNQIRSNIRVAACTLHLKPRLTDMYPMAESPQQALELYWNFEKQTWVL